MKNLVNNDMISWSLLRKRNLVHYFSRSFQMGHFQFAIFRFCGTIMKACRNIIRNLYSITYLFEIFVVCTIFNNFTG